MLGLCSTCLSQDRMVEPLDMVKFRSLFGDRKDDRVQFDVKVYTVCWECAALFRKLHNFKMQVLHAQECLQTNIEMHTMKNPLSRLSYSTINFTSACECEENCPDITFNTLNITKNCEDLQLDTIKSENDSADEDSVYTDVTDTIQVFEIKCPEIKDECSPPEGNGQREKSAAASRKRKNNTNAETLLKKNKISTIGHDKPLRNGKKLNRAKENYTILFMGDEELQAKREKDRQSVKYRLNCKYKCDSCIFSFVTKEKYDRHMRIRHSEEAGKHICVVCRRRFTRENNLRQHVATHHRKYLCACGYVGYDAGEMAHHDVAQHAISRFTCSLCGNHFPTNGTLRYHRVNAHATVKCDTCGKVFKAKSYLATHVELMHGAKPVSQCGVCGVKRKHLAAHMRKHQAKPEGAYCAECDIRFATMPIYKNHLKYAAAHSPADSLKRSCTYCDFKTVNTNTLRKHIKVKHLKEERPFKCNSCDKGFYAECRLRAHVLLKHEGVEIPRNKICHVCGRGFATKATLSNHIRVHTGEKPFRCEICDAAFSQKSSLATHTRGVHLKQKSRPSRTSHE